MDDSFLVKKERTRLGSYTMDAALPAPSILRIFWQNLHTHRGAPPGLTACQSDKYEAFAAVSRIPAVSSGGSSLRIRSDLPQYGQERPNKEKSDRGSPCMITNRLKDSKSSIIDFKINLN